MVRPNTQELSYRRQLDQRFTFDATTPDLKVVAQPVNPVEKTYVRGNNSALSKLARTLTAFNPALEIGKEIALNYKNQQLEQGHFLAQKGEDKPTEGEYLIKGYEFAEGQLHGSNYRHEVNQYLLENYNKLTPQEFEEGLSQISQKYIDTAPSDEYLKGFLPKALQEEEKVTMQYQQFVAEDFQEQAANMTSQILKDETENVLLSSLGIENIGSLESIKENQHEYLKLIGRLEGSELGTTLRATLTQVQETAQGMNLDKQLVSELLVHQLGALAVNTGLPDLMDFASVPDKGGIKLETNPDLMGAINAYREQAQSEQDRILEIQDKKSTEETKKRIDNMIVDATYQINDLQDMTDLSARAEQAKVLRETFRKDPDWKEDIPANTRIQIDEVLTKLANGDKVFRDTSLREPKEELLNKVYSDELSAEDVMVNADNLSAGDYKFFLMFVKQQEEIEEEEALSAEQERQAAIAKQQEERQKEIETISKQYYKDTKDNIINYLAKSLGSGAFANPEQAAAIEQILNTKFIMFTLQNGRPPTIEEADQMFNDFLGQSKNSPISSVSDLLLTSYNPEDPVTTPTDIVDSGAEKAAADEYIEENNITVDEEQPMTAAGVTALEGAIDNFDNNPEAVGMIQEALDFLKLPIEQNKKKQQEQQEVTTETESQAPKRRDFTIPKLEVYTQFGNALRSGLTMGEAVESGVEQGYFNSPEEASTYAASYAFEYVKNYFTQNGVLEVKPIRNQLLAMGYPEEQITTLIDMVLGDLSQNEK